MAQAVEELRQTQKKYASRAMIAAIIIGFCLILVGYKPIGKGLILGTLFSIINFVLIGQTLPMTLGYSKRKTFLISLGSITFRFSFMAIPLIISVKFDNFNLFAVISGLFMIQIVILVDHIFTVCFQTDQKL